MSEMEKLHAITQELSVCILHAAGEATKGLTNNDSNKVLLATIMGLASYAFNCLPAFTRLEMVDKLCETLRKQCAVKL